MEIDELLVNISLVHGLVILMVIISQDICEWIETPMISGVPRHYFSRRKYLGEKADSLRQRLRWFSILFFWGYTVVAGGFLFYSVVIGGSEKYVYLIFIAIYYIALFYSMYIVATLVAIRAERKGF